MSLALGFLDTLAGSLPYVQRGPATGPQLLVIQPLFEERNRLRRLLAGTTRRLADAGIGSWLFDLPGTGDSDLPTGAATWKGWREALRLAADHITKAQQSLNPAHPERSRGTHGLSMRPSTSLGMSGSGEPKGVYILSVRGGCLLDDIESEATYRFAPVAGERLLREMLRARIAGGDGETIASLQAAIERGETLNLAGYAIPAALAKALDLAEALPIPVRTAVTGDGTADIRLSGPPLWRQAEPVEAPELAAALAADIASWIAACAAR